MVGIGLPLPAESEDRIRWRHGCPSRMVEEPLCGARLHRALGGWGKAPQIRPSYEGYPSPDNTYLPTYKSPYEGCGCGHLGHRAEFLLTKAEVDRGAHVSLWHGRLASRSKASGAQYKLRTALAKGRAGGAEGVLSARPAPPEEVVFLNGGPIWTVMVTLGVSHGPGPIWLLRG